MLLEEPIWMTIYNWYISNFRRTKSENLFCIEMTFLKDNFNLNIQSLLEQNMSFVWQAFDACCHPFRISFGQIHISDS